jgi:predicted RecB family endonuclease
MTDSRAKGRKGETTARLLLESRDYTCEDLSAGRASCDILAIKDGVVHAVEVKDQVSIRMYDFRKQARANAKKGVRWMVMAHICGTRSWLVERQGERPCVWHERGK